ncbi:MAG: hypothetical protein LBC92_04955 [Rickettsiales bacterium]|jgi:myo-inositol-1(or 4)-monophosphatase|nr:hypothetical protein [Rickettsiales bacterium]
MPIFSTNLLNIKDSILKVSEKIVRDYYELENLQSSFNGTSKFTNILLNTVKDKFLYFFNKTDYEVFYENEKVKDGNNGKIFINIDGKLNLAHSIPYFCIAVTYQKQDKIICGVIENPITQETFMVERGSGGYLNNKKIRVSNRESANESIIALTKYNPKYQDSIITKSALLNMCYLSSGKYDMTVVNDSKVNEIGVLLAKESGALTINNKDEIIITNGKLKI